VAIDVTKNNAKNFHWIEVDVRTVGEEDKTLTLPVYLEESLDNYSSAQKSELFKNICRRSYETPLSQVLNVKWLGSEAALREVLETLERILGKDVAPLVTQYLPILDTGSPT